MKDTIYTTELGKDECLAILREHYVPLAERIKMRFSPPEPGTIFTMIDGETFRVEAQGAKFVRNSFVPIFYGDFVSATHETCFKGRIQMHPFVKVFMAVWFGLLGIFTLLSLLHIFSIFAGSDGSGSTSFLVILVPVFMLAFGVGLLKLGRLMSRKQRQSIEHFLSVKLMAREEA